jgi:hypothetical protein
MGIGSPLKIKESPRSETRITAFAWVDDHNGFVVALQCRAGFQPEEIGHLDFLRESARLTCLALEQIGSGNYDRRYRAGAIINREHAIGSDENLLNVTFETRGCGLFDLWFASVLDSPAERTQDSRTHLYVHLAQGEGVYITKARSKSHDSPESRGMAQRRP